MIRLARCSLLLLAVGPASCSAAHAPRARATSPGQPVAATETDWTMPTSTRTQALGALSPVLVANAAAAAGDSVGGRVSVPEGQCGLFLAGGSPSVEDLDLFVYESDGSQLAADETPRASAAAMVCPPHPTQVYVFARVAVGHGLVSVSYQELPRARAKAVASAAGTRAGLEVSALPESGWPGLDEALGRRRRALGGTWHDARRAAVPMDPRVPTRVSAIVEAGQCLDAVVVPGDEVAYVEMAVLDAQGRIIGRDGGDGHPPALTVCTPGRTEVTFDLRPHAGRGLAALSLSVADDPRSVERFGGVIHYDDTAQRSVDEARAALDERLDALGYARPKRLSGTATVGARKSHEIDLAAGCTRIDVVTGTPGRGIETWLWAADGTLVAHDTGTTETTLFACVPGGRGRLDVEGVTRSGPFDAQIRPTKDVAQALLQHPLAAGRLLGRLSDAGWLRVPRDAGAPSVLAVTETSLASEEMLVPVGRCLDVALALGPAAEGAEVRLVDASDGTEIALSRGTHSALAEACAAGRPDSLRLRIEARTGAGATDALVAKILRALPPPVRRGR